MNIKRCDINDLELLIPLFDDYRQHFKQSSEPELIQEFLAQRIESDDVIIYLAHTNNDIHGFVLLYPSYSSIGLSKIWILNDFYLRSGNQKRLMAKQLLDQLVADCKEAGAIRIEVTTRKENHKLHNLYKEYGFEKDYKYDHYFLQVTKGSASNMLK